MSSPTAVLSYGQTIFQLGEAPRIVRRSDGFDEGQFEFIGGEENSCLPGSAVPGYSGMICAEDSITDHSGDLDHSIRAVGLRSGSSRRIAWGTNSEEEGFDTGTETWIYPSTYNVSYGRTHTDSSQLYCVAFSFKNSPVSNYRIIEMQFKGVANGSRPDRYKFSTLTREMTIENCAIPAAGGDGLRLHTWNIAIGSAVMDKFYISNVMPSYHLIGKMIAPPSNFPNTEPIPWTVPTEVAKYQWPNGVMLAAINADQIPGKQLYFVQETYVQRDRIIV
jgi:hypothetical protein